MTPSQIRAIACDPSAPVETRRAAADALAALERLGTRLRLDAGAATSVVPVPGDEGVRRTWRAP